MSVGELVLFVVALLLVVYLLHTVPSSVLGAVKLVLLAYGLYVLVSIVGFIVFMIAAILLLDWLDRR